MDPAPEYEDLRKYLTIVPASGELLSSQDRNSQSHSVLIGLKAEKEIQFKDVQLIKCQIMDTQSAENAIIANIPIRISCKAVYSK